MGENTGLSRRDFLKNMAIGVGGLVFVGGFGVAFRHVGTDGRTVKGIVVDFTKCTGCRTCETVCSAFNHPVEVNGELLKGLGNPWLSNIKIQWFNPDVDVPMVCSLCDDAPCILACPVPPDLVTGRKALYHDTETHTVKNDTDRCVGCGQCAKSCNNMRTGVIYQHPNGKPFGMCSLCDGDPQCVKECTFDALQFVELTDETNYRKQSAKSIARKLIWKFYEIEV